MSFEKNIGKSLNIFEEPKNQEVILPDQDEEFINDDYEYARRNIRELIDASTGEVHNLLDIARKSESPRAYEVVANMLRTLSETNKDLLRIAKDRKDLKTTSDKSQSEGVTNNNLFVGSTKELQDFIEEQKKKKNE
jgi:hypothetical protein